MNVSGIESNCTNKELIRKIPAQQNLPPLLWRSVPTPPQQEAATVIVVQEDRGLAIPVLEAALATSGGDGVGISVEGHFDGQPLVEALEDRLLEMGRALVDFPLPLELDQGSPTAMVVIPLITRGGLGFVAPSVVQALVVVLELLRLLEGHDVVGQRLLGRGRSRRRLLLHLLHLLLLLRWRDGGWRDLSEGQGVSWLDTTRASTGLVLGLGTTGGIGGDA